MRSVIVWLAAEIVTCVAGEEPGIRCVSPLEQSSSRQIARICLSDCFNLSGKAVCICLDLSSALSLSSDPPRSSTHFSSLYFFLSCSLPTNLFQHGGPGWGAGLEELILYYQVLSLEKTTLATCSSGGKDSWASSAATKLTEVAANVSFLGGSVAIGGVVNHTV